MQKNSVCLFLFEGMSHAMTSPCPTGQNRSTSTTHLHRHTVTCVQKYVLDGRCVSDRAPGFVCPASGKRNMHGGATDLPHMSGEINVISLGPGRVVELQVQVRDKQPAAGLGAWRDSFHDARIDRSIVRVGFLDYLVDHDRVEGRYYTC
jgi:hypothetical protein